MFVIKNLNSSDVIDKSKNKENILVKSNKDLKSDQNRNISEVIQNIKISY